MVIILPVGAAKQGGPHPGHLLNLIITGIQILCDLLRAQAVEMGMVIGMAHNLVPRVMQRLD